MSIERALVTGGASGLGAVIVRALAGRGVQVVIADRDHARATDLAVDLENSGGRITVAEVDMSEESAVRALFQPGHEGRRWTCWSTTRAVGCPAPSSRSGTPGCGGST